MFVVKGENTGRFGFALSATLRPIGGTFDKQRKVWLIPDDKVEAATPLVANFPGLSLREDVGQSATPTPASKEVVAKPKRDLTVPVDGVAVTGEANQGGARWWPLYYRLKPLGGVFDKPNNCWVVPVDKCAEAAEILKSFPGLTIAVPGEAVAAGAVEVEQHADVTEDVEACAETPATVGEGVAFEAKAPQDDSDILAFTTASDAPEALPDAPKKRKKGKASVAVAS